MSQRIRGKITSGCKYQLARCAHSALFDFALYPKAKEEPGSWPGQAMTAFCVWQWPDLHARTSARSVARRDILENPTKPWPFGSPSVFGQPKLLGLNGVQLAWGSGI